MQFLRPYTLPKSSAYAARTFAKVLVARRTTTFGKVDYSDYQLFFVLCYVGKSAVAEYVLQTPISLHFAKVSDFGKVD